MIKIHFENDNMEGSKNGLVFLGNSCQIVPALV